MTSEVVGEHIAAATKRTGRQEHVLAHEPIVGKDILELLSSAMYVDPLTVYREYVQNSADAIDDAFRQGLLSEPSLGRVDIDLDPVNRTIRIKDTGTGIGAADAERVLTSFGASQKRGTRARGFRGVGRLAAFGYAQVVTFKSKAAGEQVAISVRWDCRKLKATLLDPEYRGDLKQIVRDVVTVVKEGDPSPDSHYFQVTLEHVMRIKNDVLLNPDEVERYLSEVAPAPFHASFRSADEVNRLLGRYIAPAKFGMFLNASAEPITRPYRNEIALSTTKYDMATEIEAIEIPNSDGGMLAVGWILHHGYLGAIHGAGSLRGLRARVGDIQVGNDETFIDVFPESRFNSWTIGELHIVDQRITPNGRRDGFEQNAAFAELHAQLVPIGRSQTQRCHQSSERRNKLRKFEQRAERLDAILNTLRQRATSRTKAVTLRRESGAIIDDMRKSAKGASLPETDRATMRARISELEEKVGKVKEVAGTADHFAGVSGVRRIVYEQVFDIIYKSMPTQAAANKLVDKILAQLPSPTKTPPKRLKKKVSTSR